MSKNSINNLSRRERQIMDVIYRQREATAMDIMNNIPNPPTYAAVRRLIAILEEKGYVTHRTDGPRYVFRALEEMDDVRKSAISHLKDTFFRGSAVKAVAAILDLSSNDLTDSELDELGQLIESARSEGR